ncbi:MAG TPA: aldose epimerase family protein [Bacteroidota bacterium]|nr:aldose epimerase family protein [Bacteroidota bacterium]
MSQFLKVSFVSVSLAAVSFFIILESASAQMSISRESYGMLPDGRSVDLFTLVNKNGMKVGILNYGGIVTELWVPDRNGKLGDVVLGFDSLGSYLHKSPYFGALVGRYANRIAGARFTLDGVEYHLAANDHHHSLHGGSKGFDKVLWTAEPVQTQDSVALRLTYVSKDGEEGYPGNLTVMIVYSLDNQNALKILYEATTDKPTIINLTHHSYFNLADSGDILGHEIMIRAESYTPVDSTLIPTGEMREVAGTPFDFRTPQRIGAHIDEVPGGGYDHNFVLSHRGGVLSLAAKVFEPASGRIMEVWTTEPGLQFYSGNFLDGTAQGKSGRVYGKHYGFCLEAQHFPDSPHEPTFPAVVLRPGDRYHQETIYQFSAEKSR